jgi:cytochrome c551/c552
MSDHHHELPPPEPDQIQAGGITFWGLTTFAVVLLSIAGLSGFFWQSVSEAGENEGGSKFYSDIKKNAQAENSKRLSTINDGIKAVIADRGQAVEKVQAVEVKQDQLVAPQVFTVDAAKAEKGKALYENPVKMCKTCHSLDGSRVIGPSFKGFYGRQIKLSDGTQIYANTEYFINSVKNPAAQMQEGYPPGMPGIPLTDEEIDHLLHFVASQK